MANTADGKRDFFVSFNQADRASPASGILPRPVFRATAGGHNSALALSEILEATECELGGEVTF